MSKQLEEYLRCSAEMGRHSLFSECCIQAFVADERAGIKLVAMHRVEQLGFTWKTRPLKGEIGYVPCLSCYKVLLAGGRPKPTHRCNEHSKRCRQVCLQIDKAIEALMGEQMKEWTIEDIQIYLAKHGRDIGKAASRGHVQSQRIIKLYGLHRSCPSDPGAHGLLAAALDELEKDRLSAEKAAEVGG